MMLSDIERLVNESKNALGKHGEPPRYLYMHPIDSQDVLDDIIGKCGMVRGTQNINSIRGLEVIEDPKCPLGFAYISSELLLFPPPETGLEPMPFPKLPGAQQPRWGKS